MSAAMDFSNGDSQPYWQRAAEGRLQFQKCRACGAVQFPPRHHCASCWEAELDWVESKGRGTVESFTVVRRAALPQFRDNVPYVIAAITVSEGPRMITALVGDTALEVKIGDPVTVEFRPDAGGNVLPVFRRI